MKQVLLFILLIGVIAACGEDRQAGGEESQPEAIPFRTDGVLTFLQDGREVVTIDIEIAASDSARQRGLMQRTSLPDRSGMLFDFPREEIQSFWMANTPLALDLIFVDADSQIVDIDKYTKPFSSTSIVSDAPARYVVEVPAGFADTHGLLEGGAVAWERTEAPGNG